MSVNRCLPVFLGAMVAGCPCRGDCNMSSVRHQGNGKKCEKICFPLTACGFVITNLREVLREVSNTGTAKDVHLG